MAIANKVSAKQRRNNHRTTLKSVGKNGHGRGKPTSKAGVYMLRPRRTPAALRRARRYAELVRQELASAELGTLAETMSNLRGRPWS